MPMAHVPTDEHDSRCRRFLPTVTVLAARSRDSIQYGLLEVRLTPCHAVPLFFIWSDDDEPAGVTYFLPCTPPEGYLDQQPTPLRGVDIENAPVHIVRGSQLGGALAELSRWVRQVESLEHLLTLVVDDIQDDIVGESADLALLDEPDDEVDDPDDGGPCAPRESSDLALTGFGTDEEE